MMYLRNYTVLRSKIPPNSGCKMSGFDWRWFSVVHPPRPSSSPTHAFWPGIIITPLKVDLMHCFWGKFPNYALPGMRTYLQGVWNQIVLFSSYPTFKSWFSLQFYLKLLRLEWVFWTFNSLNETPCTTQCGKRWFILFLLKTFEQQRVSRWAGPTKSSLICYFVCNECSTLAILLRNLRSSTDNKCKL